MASTPLSSLSSRLTLLVLLAFVPAFGLVVYGSVQSQRQLASQVEAAALQVAHRASTDHEQLIAGTRQLLVTLTRVPEVSRADPLTCGAFFADLIVQQPYYSNLLSARPDGEVTCTAVPLPGPGPVNIGDREHFQRALRTRDFAIGQYLIGRIQRAPTFPIAYPIVDTDGQVQRVIIATLSLQWLSHLAASTDLPEGARLTVFDRTGSVLARYPDSDLSVGQSVPERLLEATLHAEDDGGTVEITDRDGVSQLVAFSPMGSDSGTPGVFVSVGIPTDLAFAEVRRTLKLTLAVLAALTVLVLGITHLASERFILRPVRQLLSAARRIAAGDLVTRIGTGPAPRELRQLAETFDQMAETLQSRDERVRRQADRLHALAEASKEFTGARLDRDTVLRTITRYVAEKTGGACILRVLSPDRRSLIATVIDHPDPAHRELLSGLLHGAQPVESGVSGRVMATGQAVHTIPQIDGAFRSSLRPELLPYLDRFGISSVLVVPLRVQNEVIGTMGLWRDGGAPPSALEDQEFLQSLADHAAQAIENAQLYARAEDTLNELQQTQMKVVQQERLRALGTMASGIAHDFNNALAPVLGHSEHLLARPALLQDTQRVTKALESIHTSAGDAAAVVRRLREFYRFREQGDAILPIDLNQVIKESRSLTQPKWKDQAQAQGVTIKIITALQKLPPVPCNAAEIREAITNLIFNSVDAMPNGGTITVATRREQDHAVLEVSDTGQGMTSEVRARCLEPFFTTKEERGTGLGLPMIFGIVKRHRGSLDIKSVAGEGTTVTISLPLTGKVPEPEGRPEIPSSVVDQLRILLIDDEPSILEILADLLAEDGHEVEAVGDGREALSRFRAGQFDLVITDRAMPEISGDRLAALVKQLKPTVPVILLTGFGDLMRADGERPTGVDLVVAKPVTIATLREAIAQATGVLPVNEAATNGRSRPTADISLGRS